MTELTHLDEQGRARMVNVGDKDITTRRAIATGRLRMQASTIERIFAGSMPKGDVLAVARTAGIMAAKQTANLIPLCHSLALDSVTVEFSRADSGVLLIRATAEVAARTGVEMEALVAVTVSGLTIYDMCKAVDRAMELTDVRLEEKSGGRSGLFRRD
jgi:cyclic pyranopterin phosphate synthase